MDLKDSTSKDIDINQINNLTESVGWGRRKTEKWKEILSKSSFVYTIWEGKNLIGIGRILEDGIMCMFYDIAVKPSYQGRGIGTTIMNKLINEVKDKSYVSIGLFAWEGNPQNIPFYKKFGFKKVGTGMELEKYMKRED